MVKQRKEHKRPILEKETRKDLKTSSIEWSDEVDEKEAKMTNAPALFDNRLLSSRQAQSL